MRYGVGLQARNLDSATSICLVLDDWNCSYSVISQLSMHSQFFDVQHYSFWKNRKPQYEINGLQWIVCGLGPCTDDVKRRYNRRALS